MRGIRYWIKVLKKERFYNFLKFLFSLSIITGYTNGIGRYINTYKIRFRMDHKYGAYWRSRIGFDGRFSLKTNRKFSGLSVFYAYRDFLVIRCQTFLRRYYAPVEHLIYIFLLLYLSNMPRFRIPTHPDVWYILYV